MNFAGCRAVVVVFAMPGCPACEDYKPRLEREVARWQAHAPFVFAEGDQHFAPGQIPVVFLNAESTDAQLQQLADVHDIQGLPTTLVFTRRHPFWGPATLTLRHKIEGSIDDRQIYDLLNLAAHS
jgi:thiol-disulfide isomerase/thioredoxin